MLPCYPNVSKNRCGFLFLFFFSMSIYSIIVTYSFEIAMDDIESLVFTWLEIVYGINWKEMRLKYKLVYVNSNAFTLDVNSLWAVNDRFGRYFDYHGNILRDLRQWETCLSALFGVVWNDYHLSTFRWIFSMFELMRKAKCGSFWDPVVSKRSLMLGNMVFSI